MKGLRPSIDTESMKLATVTGLQAILGKDLS